MYTTRKCRRSSNGRGALRIQMPTERGRGIPPRRWVTHGPYRWLRTRSPCTAGPAVRTGRRCTMGDALNRDRVSDRQGTVAIDRGSVIAVADGRQCGESLLDHNLPFSRRRARIRNAPWSTRPGECGFAHSPECRDSINPYHCSWVPPGHRRIPGGGPSPGRRKAGTESTYRPCDLRRATVRR